MVAGATDAATAPTATSGPRLGSEYAHAVPRPYRATVPSNTAGSAAAPTANASVVAASTATVPAASVVAASRTTARADGSGDPTVSVAVGSLRRPLAVRDSVGATWPAYAASPTAYVAATTNSAAYARRSPRRRALATLRVAAPLPVVPPVGAPWPTELDVAEPPPVELSPVEPVVAFATLALASAPVVPEREDPLVASEADDAVEESDRVDEVEAPERFDPAAEPEDVDAFEEDADPEAESEPVVDVDPVDSVDRAEDRPVAVDDSASDSDPGPLRPDVVAPSASGSASIPMFSSSSSSNDIEGSPFIRFATYSSWPSRSYAARSAGSESTSLARLTSVNIQVARSPSLRSGWYSRARSR